MGFLDNLRKAFGGSPGAKGSGGGGSSFGKGDPDAYWVYAQCRRCGEPLRARVNLMNEPSEAEDGEGWIVRKGLAGTGARRCFQSIEVTLHFNAGKKTLLDSEVIGGKLITAEEYEALIRSAADARGDEGAR